MIEVPLHVTAFWKPVWRRSPISTGSLGAGVVLRPGALCYPSELPWPPVPSALGLGRVRCRLPVSVGKGFATSAAVSLAASFFSSKSFLEAVAKAHVSEVLYRTGLGDVMSISFGSGIAVRTEAGGPGWGKVESIAFPKGVSVLGVELEGRFKDTPTMLSKLRTDEAFEGAWKILERGWDFLSFLEAAETFSRELKFMNRELKDKVSVRGVLGAYVKKSAMLVFVEGVFLNDVIEKLRKRGLKPKTFVPARWSLKTAS